MANLRIELLTLGDELLNGIRVNQHLSYIGEQLARFGLDLQRNVTFRDDPEEIRKNFDESLKHSDIIITTGGLGPTTDDNTREVIAECLGLPLEFHQSIEEAIQKRFDSMGRTMTENNLKQCYIPQSADILANALGTAPGIWIPYGKKIIIMLPGPGNELRPMFERVVIPRLQREGIIQEQFGYIQLRTVGIGESALQEKMKPVFDKNPGIGVGYCAHQGIVDLRLSQGQGTFNTSEIQAVAEECRDLLGEDFICFGHDSLARVVFNHLRADEKTISVAESCTGGLLSNSFTDLAGSSKVFSGGVVCYNNDAKMELLDVPECILQQHGAVSAETAVAMATGAMEKFSSDYALSVTGFAGPSGGNTRSPVGTIHIGYASPLGVWSIRMVYPGERAAVKQRAVNRALDVLRRMLKKYMVEDAIQSMLSAN